MDKLSGAGSAGNAISGFLNSFGLQPEVQAVYFIFYVNFRLILGASTFTVYLNLCNVLMSISDLDNIP